ncbi:MAG TPA: NAD(P)-dependent oxidoreductase [Candidatus Omnitrophota bacterium]|nr:NAD(P)-dependent oxidoreductase [Candidatus Omnitrophota bacterium]HPN87923.1 NAD(P)-dependent oxidoreductase [Candidatus Omnitrophota bacterium]
MRLRQKRIHYDVVFYEVYDQERDFLQHMLPRHIKARYVPQTIQECHDNYPLSSLISIRTQSRIPLSWAKNLSGILARTQGYDHLAAYQQKVQSHIACGYLGPYCSRAVAEHAIMSMMLLWRQAKKQIRHFNTFLRDGLMGQNCSCRRALVVGVGHIGSQIVDMARGLRMEVRGVDIQKRLKNLQYVFLKKGILWADVVFCALPLTDQTNKMLNYATLKYLKKGALFINISRGEISPIQDLKRLLSQKILGGLSLDVYEQESLLADYLRGHSKKKNRVIKTILSLKDRDNVLLTPHNAFNTEQALRQKTAMTVGSVVSFLKTKKFPYPVRIL